MNEFILRLKLLLSDRTAGICYIVSVLVVLLMLGGLNLHAAERSAVPIGLVCMDNADSALKLRDRICDSESLYVYEGSREEMTDLLKDGYIECIFIINEDYTPKLKAGETDGIVELITADDSHISSVVSDIVAGCMMYDVCLFRAYRTYSGLEGESMSLDAYQAYVDGLLTDPDYTYSFDISFSGTGSNGLDYRDITNAMIYRQAIGGMMAMLLMLMAYCSCYCMTTESERLLRRRRGLLPGRKLLPLLKEFPAVLLYLLPMTIVLSVSHSDSGYSLKGGLLILNVVFVILSAAVSCLLALTLSSSFAYQLAGSFIILACGIMGFVYVYSGLLGTELFAACPCSRYIDYYIKMIG